MWCTVCNIEVSRGEPEEIPATVHEWGEWTEKDGWLVRCCANCDAEETKPVEHTAEPENENDTKNIISLLLDIFKQFVRMIRNLFGK